MYNKAVNKWKYCFTVLFEALMVMNELSKVKGTCFSRIVNEKSQKQTKSVGVIYSKN